MMVSSTGLVQMGEEQTRKTQQELGASQTEFEMHVRQPRGKSRGRKHVEVQSSGETPGLE